MLSKFRRVKSRSKRKFSLSWKKSENTITLVQEFRFSFFFQDRLNFQSLRVRFHSTRFREWKNYTIINTHFFIFTMNTRRNQRTIMAKSNYCITVGTDDSLPVARIESVMHRYHGNDLPYRFVMNNDQSVISARNNPTSISEDTSEPYMMTRYYCVRQGRVKALQLQHIQLPFEIRRTY